MSLDTVTLEDALNLLSLPRTVGEIDGEEVTAQNGKFGPYIKKGTDSRSLTSEEALLTVTIEQAKELFAQPKTRGRRAAAAPPCASWDRIRSPASRSWSRRAASGRT
nr:hypothetical protein GCM10020093_072980 [Planobispora longispora]